MPEEESELGEGGARGGEKSEGNWEREGQRPVFRLPVLLKLSG